MSSLYVYAILLDPPADLPEGTAPVRCGELIVVTRAAGPSAAASEADLRAHDAMVRALLDRVDPVLPVRYGTVVPGVEELDDLVRARTRYLRETLELVRGARQMTLRVLGMPAGSDPAPPPQLGGAGSRYLLDRARAAARRRDVPEIGALREALRPLLRAEQAERHDRPPLLASVYHLVGLDDLGRYRETVAAISGALAPVRVRVSGPWPAYAFAER